MVEHVKTVLDRCPSLCCGPWVDLGTGSGALAISIAAEVLRMRASSALENGCMDGKPVVHAVDLSLSSVQIARCNASRHFSLTERGKDAVQIHQGSWFEPLESLDIVHRHAGTLAGIVSNPPYISSDEMLDLQPEVRYHEPWLALESGRNGVEALELICEGASRYLLPGGSCSSRQAAVARPRTSTGCCAVSRKQKTEGWFHYLKTFRYMQTIMVLGDLSLRGNPFYFSLD
jgi:release factor glutamine methyltransferase